MDSFPVFTAMETIAPIQFFNLDTPPPDEDSEPNCTTIEGCADAEALGYLFFHIPIALTGVVLNSLNLAVFTRTKFKLNGATFTYLTAQAFADLMTCALVWPIGIMRCAPYSHSWQHYFREIYEIYIYVPIANSFGAASVWITVAVSVERYCFIGNSSISQMLCSRRVAKRIIAAIYVCGFLINVPYYFHRRVSHTDEPNYTDWADTTGYVVYGWCRFFFMKLIPILMIATFNTMLSVVLWRSNRKMKTLVFPGSMLARRQRMQIRTTAMLITISVIFLLCNILEPFIHSSIYISLFGPCSIYTEKYAFLRTLANTLEVFSFASNFVVYCIFNKQFTAALAKTCMCKSCPCPCPCSSATEDKTIPEECTVNTVQ